MPLPPAAGNYAEQFMFDEKNRPAFSKFRDDVKPIEITQPDAAQFHRRRLEGAVAEVVDAAEIQSPRGHCPARDHYTDRGENRPIVYRASLSEMVVPYGDTEPTHWNKNVFDMSEVGMGFSANPLTLGCDCLGARRRPMSSAARWPTS